MSMTNKELILGVMREQGRSDALSLWMGGCERMNVKQKQALLAYLGYDTGGVDGI